MRSIGSQQRETLDESGYRFVKSLGNGLIVLEDESGQELWRENDHYAGYVIEYQGKGYEYVREA